MNSPKLRLVMRQRRRQVALPFGAQRFLSVLEGVEGGFAVGSGVIAGLSFASITNLRTLVITAAISILLNGFNAAALKYTSEHYEDELDGHVKQHRFQAYFIPAAIEFAAYFLICGLTLIPLAIFPHHLEAVIWNCALTCIVLFAAGMWKGYLLHTRKPLHDGIELALLGLLIIGGGAGAGYLLNAL
ncbi:VIT1/CCC1 transporter family protein [Candidatus Saccharibacteria bacterium]|nr:VIT1/CCC1 transporter family protein [Candidatus Saccharibacteria bacterium]